MTQVTIGNDSQVERLPNGAGAAAIFAAGIGSFASAAFAIIADHSLGIKKLMIFYTPTGPLSGVTSIGIAVWLVCWFALHTAWRRRDLPGWIVSAGLFLLAISFVLMFPPIGDLF